MAFVKIDFKEFNDQGTEVVARSEYINGANVVSLADSRTGEGKACCRVYLVGGRTIEVEGQTASALSAKL